MAGPSVTRREVLKSAAAFCLTSLLVGANPVPPFRKLWAYVGGYSNIGIRLFNLDLLTGDLSDFGIAVEIPRSSFLTVAPSGNFLYSCFTRPDANKTLPFYRLGAFAVDPQSGKLAPLNDRPCGGDNPCFISIDSAEKNALVANFDSATVASLPIDSTGRLGDPASVLQQSGSSIVPVRQTQSHPHSINLDPQNRFVFVPDLGADRIFIYRFDVDRSKLSPANPPTIIMPPGSGPRHMAFHPGGKLAYLVCELSNRLVVFAYDADRGRLTQLQSISTLPPDYVGHAQTAELQLHPAGKFLFCSVRGPDNVTTFSIDPSTGKLARIGAHSTLGNWPRNFRIDPSGNYLIAANQRSDSIVLFRIAPNGTINPLGQPWKVPQPSCVKFIPAK